MIVLSITILLVLIVMAMIASINTLSFPRLEPETVVEHQAKTPLISVLVPARNEADHIASTLSGLLAQDYPTFELIVLDDHSTDETANIIERSVDGNPHCKFLQGTDLPPGWTGKNWACQQLGSQAKGDILVFTDADVHWETGALSGLVVLMQRQKADCLTVWPTQHTYSWAERLVVPMMMLTIIAYLPELCVRYVPWPVFAAANGQCLAFRRLAYLRIGGHEAVKGKIVEDIQLAWEIKRKGLRMVEALGNGLIWGRMYRNWREVKQGFGKNILAGHGESPLSLLLSTCFHWLVFVLPWIWMVSGFFIQTSLWPEYPIAMVFLGLLVRLLSAAATQQRLVDGLFLPISVGLMTVIAGQSMWYYRKGGPTWKGRQILRKG